MKIIKDSAQTLHTPDGRYKRQIQPPFDGPLGCGHTPPAYNHAWQRVTSLQPEPTLPKTVCTDCLENYCQAFATSKPDGADQT